MFVIFSLVLLTLAVICWALSWLVFISSALLSVSLFVRAKISPIEYSIGGLRRFLIALWRLVQNPKSRLQLCALTGAGVAVLRVVAWSAVYFANRLHPNGAAKIVGFVVFPEVFLSSLNALPIAVCGIFVLESVLVSSTLWFSLYIARIIFNGAARLWPRLETKARNDVLRWLGKV